MTNSEHVLFQDIPSTGKNGKYDSAILTTYVVDLMYFDRHLRNTLHRKQISSINILADSGQLDKVLNYINPRYLSYIGKEYCVSGVSSAGAFHPKLNFFIGNEAALVLVGSGNLTATGHGKNHEAFTGFMIDADNEAHRPIIEECWQYLKSYVARVGDFERRRILTEIPANCKFLKEDYDFIPHALHRVADNLEAALLYNESDSSIISQIANKIPLEDVTRITVVSPYYPK